MEIIAGTLSAHYKGRGESHLSAYSRIVMIKDDGSVCIHGDTGYKPMNYMMAPTSRHEEVKDGKLILTITGKNEKLTITFTEVTETITLPLGNEDPGLKRISTEDHLQEWLYQHPEFFEPKIHRGEREYQTGRGPVDLFFECYDGSGLVVEVKRVAALNTVGQLLRYTDAIEENHPGRALVGVIAALEFKQSVLELAHKKNIICVEIPAEWNTIGPEVRTKPGVVVTFDPKS